MRATSEIRLREMCSSRCLWTTIFDWTGFFVFTSYRLIRLQSRRQPIFPFPLLDGCESLTSANRVAFSPIACLAQQLKVSSAIASAFRYRNNVIELQVSDGFAFRTAALVSPPNFIAGFLRNSNSFVLSLSFWSIFAENKKLHFTALLFKFLKKNQTSFLT